AETGTQMDIFDIRHGVGTERQSATVVPNQTEAVIAVAAIETISCGECAIGNNRVRTGPAMHRVVAALRDVENVPAVAACHDIIAGTTNHTDNAVGLSAAVKEQG